MSVFENTQGLPGKQKGLTLVEMLVAAVISLIAVAGMVLLMANTLGTGTQTIAAGSMSNQLRSALRIIERDIRRANYNEEFDTCIGIGSVNCTAVPDTMASMTTGDPGCIVYSYERAGAPVRGGFRLNAGALEFANGATSCGAGAWTWEQLTDPQTFTVTNFNVQPAGYQTALPTGMTQTVRKVDIAIAGQFCRGSDCVSKEVVNTIRVRNDILTVTAPVVP